MTSLSGDYSCFHTLTFPVKKKSCIFVQGTNLDSVERSEIRVTVGGEVCKDRGAEGDDMDIVRYFFPAKNHSVYVIILSKVYDD